MSLMTLTKTRRLCAMCGVVCLVLLGMTGVASAQDNSGAVDEQEYRFNTSRQMVFVPTLALNMGFSTQFRPGAEPRDNIHLSIAGGLAANLVMSENVLSYLSANLEVEHHELDDGREVTYFMPMAQAGFSFTGCYDEPDRASVLMAMFPCAKVYGLAGLRPAPAGRPASLRVGVGFASVWIPAVALSAGGILPSSYEAIMEVDPIGNRLYMFRMGLGF